MGSIPPELGYLIWLDLLDLQDNRLVGSIPTEIGLLTNLEYLALNSNKLQGEIPNTLSSLKRAEAILLYYNDLTGVVSTDMCTLVDDLWLYNFQTDCQSEGGEYDVPAVKCECCTYCCDGLDHCSPRQWNSSNILDD